MFMAFIVRDFLAMTLFDALSCFYGAKSANGYPTDRVGATAVLRSLLWASFLDALPNHLRNCKSRICTILPCL
jgi:hypothetical protein